MQKKDLPIRSKSRRSSQIVAWDTINWAAVKAYLERNLTDISVHVNLFVLRNNIWSYDLKLLDQEGIKNPFHLRLAFWIEPRSKPRRKQMFYGHGYPYSFYARLNPDELAQVSTFVAELQKATNLEWEREQLERNDGLLIYTHHPTYDDFRLSRD